MAPTPPGASSLITDSQLGLSADEINVLRHHQQVVLTQAGGSSSRAASHGSSERLLLDPSSLTALSNHFDRVLGAIEAQWTALKEQAEASTQAQYDRAGDAIGNAEAEIARSQAVLRQLDELQTELDKTKRIGEIVKSFKARVEELDRRVGR